jgi:SAM-dependent methyltransferase
MINPQNEFYDDHVDYRVGSPHLAHPKLNKRLIDLIVGEIEHLSASQLPLTVLEIGAGHGHFTGVALAAGCDVTAIEMARASVDVLQRRFGSNDAFRVVLSEDGSIEDAGTEYSMVLCVSVLHHVPDYLAFLDTATGRLRPGGTLMSLQDPLYYERVSRPTMATTRASYALWRLRQGNLRQAASTWQRRRRGTLDEHLTADMVEYHVVRKGVDERAIEDQLSGRFGTLDLVRYWSTQLTTGQRLGDRLHLENTFGVVARDRQGAAPLQP